MAGSSSPWRRVPWGVLLTATLLSLLTAEILLRALPLGGLALARERWSVRAGALEPHPPGLYQLDPQIGWTLVPSFSGRFTGVDFDVEIRANSDGLRDDEIIPGSDEVVRVLGLGDSFGFGWGVESHESFFKLLEARLQADECVACEVVNGAIPGFGTYEALQLLKAIGPRYRPDLVVLAFYEGNDAFNNGASPRRREIRDGYLADSGGSGRSALRRWSLLANLIAERLSGVGRKRRYVADVEKTKELIADMKQLLDSSETALMLFYIPDQDPARYERPAALALYDRMLSGVGPDFLRAELTALALELGIPFCRLSGRFEAEGAELRLADTHFNPRGHELAAEELFTCLRDHRLPEGGFPDRALPRARRP